MASVLRTSLRRVVRTTVLARPPASAASFSSSARHSNENTAKSPQNSISEILNDVIEEGAATKESETSGSNIASASKAPSMNPFREQNFLKPIELRRDFRQFKANRKRPPPIGPGREARYKDLFLQLDFDPRFEYENISLMNDFTTRMGKIQPRNVTRLSQRSQRLVGKAIKRAKMMGIIPIFSSKRR